MTTIRDEDLDPGDLVLIHQRQTGLVGIWVIRPAVAAELPFGNATTSGWIGIGIPAQAVTLFAASDVVSVIKANKVVDKNDLGSLMIPPVLNPDPNL